MQELLDGLQQSEPAASVASIATNAEDIAYILYTSGSTGNPKGVVLSHGNALSFIDWCSETFKPRADDIFSSHAPFHFDLSILDIYVPLKHGATLVLIGEALGKEPLKLAATIAAEAHFRLVLDAIHPEPARQLRQARQARLRVAAHGVLRGRSLSDSAVPRPACHLERTALFQSVRADGNECLHLVRSHVRRRPDRMSTFPIGKICPPNRGMVVTGRGDRVAVGEPGELLVSGPNVMCGYWNLPEQNARRLLHGRAGRPLVSNRRHRLRRTRCRLSLSRPSRSHGQATWVPRRARRNRSCIAAPSGDSRSRGDCRPDPESGVRVRAFVVCQPGQLSKIGLKTYSAQALPPYMIPDLFEIVTALPRTSTDKIDYRRLQTFSAIAPAPSVG